MVNIKPSRLGGPAQPARRLRLLRRARHRQLRRRPVRARRRARADPVPRLAVPSRRAQRRRAERLQPAARRPPGCRRARSRRRPSASGLPLGMSRRQSATSVPALGFLLDRAANVVAPGVACTADRIGRSPRRGGPWSWRALACTSDRVSSLRRSPLRCSARSRARRHAAAAGLRRDAGRRAAKASAAPRPPRTRASCASRASSCTAGGALQRRTRGWSRCTASLLLKGTGLKAGMIGRASRAPRARGSAAARPARTCTRRARGCS